MNSLNWLTRRQGGILGVQITKADIDKAIAECKRAVNSQGKVIPISEIGDHSIIRFQ